MRAELSKEAASTSAGKWKLSTPINEIELYGDARLRYEYRGGRTASNDPDNPRDWQERKRARYRLRVGLRGSVGLGELTVVGVDELEVVSDSELLVKQMTGEYRVKNAALIELSLEAAGLAREIGRVAYSAVRRTENELADSLVGCGRPDLRRRSFETSGPCQSPTCSRCPRTDCS